MARQLVIVGAGMAAAYLLEELAQRNHEYAITVVGEESRCCYNRVLLSSLLAGEVNDADLDMLPAEHGATFLSGTRVTRIDTDQSHVVCDSGQTLHYDALVIATGAEVAMPGLDIRPAANLRVVRTVDDVKQLRAMSGGGRAVIVGGGLLGLEAAHGLNALGFSTAVLHRNRVLMNRQLDAEGGACLQRMLEARGMTIRTGVAPASLHYSDDGLLASIVLDDDARIDCDLLVFATGIRPEVSLAADGALECDKGILVDTHMHTSVAGVYALGECCQRGEETFGLVAPVREQAAVLARSLCGESGPAFDSADWPVQLKISGVDIFCAGDTEGDAQQLVVRDSRNGIYRRLAIRDDRLVGAVLVGDQRGSTWYNELIQQQDNIAALRGGLMFGREAAEVAKSAVQSAAIAQGELQ